MSLDNLPYRARFQTSASIISLKTLEKREAFAVSLEALESYIPNDVMIDGNIDLLYIAFNGTVVNQFNENGDGISVATAAKILPRFANKQINLQHDRSDIVGHTFRAGFSSLEDSVPMSEDVALQIQDPINLSVSGAIYKVVNPKLISLLKESSNAESDIYQVVSASWEIAFSEYYIALGGKNLKDATIITDPDLIKEYSQYLKGEKKRYDWEKGGEGILPDGTPVYRLIVGDDVLPTGFGLTTIPAAAVKGIQVVKDDVELDDEEEENAELNINLEINEKKSSINSQVAVNQNETHTQSTNMDIEQIKQLIQDAFASQKETDESKEAVANVISTVKEALKDADGFYTQEVEKERKATADARASEETLKASLDSTQAQLEEVLKELNDLREDSRKKAIAETFSARMSKIEDEYDLDDTDREAIASQIRELGEPAFDTWITNFARFAQAKSKAFIQARHNELTKAVEAAKKEVSASVVNVKEDVEDILDAVSASNDSKVPNAMDATSEPSLVERILAEVDKHITIS